MRILRKSFLMLIALGALAVFAPALASAATTYNVTTTADSGTSTTGCTSGTGTCTLREAVLAANETEGGSVTINVPTGDYVLNCGDACDGVSVLEINSSATVDIVGAGASSTTVDADYLDRAFLIDSGSTVTISGITIEHGSSGGLGHITTCPSIDNISSSRADGGGIDNLGSLTLDHDVVTDNFSSGYGGGIADGPGLVYGPNAVIVSSTPTLTVTGTTISDNQSCYSYNGGGYGGGIAVQDGGDVTISGSNVSNDNALNDGGGIAEVNSGATVDIDSSTLSGNTAGNNGGGIAAEGGGTFNLFADTLSGNTAGNQGGGLTNEGPDTDTWVDDTVVGNTSSSGGGISSIPNYNTGYPSDTVSFSTITDNSAGSAGPGGNLYVPVGEEAPLQSGTRQGALAPDAATPPHDYAGIQLDDTIVARGTGSPANCAGNALGANGVASSGYNLFDDTSDSGSQCGAISTDKVVSTADLKLGTLASNGGPTKTEALEAASPAIDAASLTNCQSEISALDPAKQTVDQRGVPRPQGPQCDIGAFEANPILNLTAKVVKDPIYVGQDDTVVDTVTNSGAYQATSTTFIDPGAGYTILSVTPSQGTCTHTAHSITCSLGKIPTGSSVTITIVLKGTSPGTITLNSSTHAAEYEPPGNIERRAVHITVLSNAKPKLADLAITDRATKSHVRKGKTFAFVLHARNYGPSTGNHVTIVNELPSQVRLLGSSVGVESRGAGGSCKAVGRRLTCTLRSMKRGASLVIHLRVKALRTGRAVDRASITDRSPKDPNLSNNHAQASAQIVRPPHPPRFTG